MFNNNDSERISPSRKQSILQKTFRTLPQSRKTVAYNSFENAPDWVFEVIRNIPVKLIIKPGSYCKFDIWTKIIYMEENMDDCEYSEVFTHEFGHFVDDQLGTISASIPYADAIDADINLYEIRKEKQETFKKMLEALGNSLAILDRAVSDLVSLFFEDDSQIRRMYDEKNITYYNHRNKEEKNDRDVAGFVSSEIYADIFSIIVQSRDASCEFVTKYFPHTYNATIQLTKNGNEVS